MFKNTGVCFSVLLIAPGVSQNVTRARSSKRIAFQMFVHALGAKLVGAVLLCNQQALQSEYHDDACRAQL